MGDDGLEPGNVHLSVSKTFSSRSKGSSAVLVGEFESFSQAFSLKLETLCPLKGDPGCLPL